MHIDLLGVIDTIFCFNYAGLPSFMLTSSLIDAVHLFINRLIPGNSFMIKAAKTGLQSVFIHPLQVLKGRMLAQSATGLTHYSNAFACAAHLLSKEGFLSLYHGWASSTLFNLLLPIINDFVRPYILQVQANIEARVGTKAAVALNVLSSLILFGGIGVYVMDEHSSVETRSN